MQKSDYSLQLIREEILRLYAKTYFLQGFYWKTFKVPVYPRAIFFNVQ
jgi:hypothetical protein